MIQALAERVDLRLGKWTEWTPTFTGLTATGVSAAYCRTVDLVTCRMTFIVQAISLGWYFTLPMATDSSMQVPLGNAAGQRTGVRYWYGLVQLASTVEAKIIDGPSGTQWSNTFPATWVAGDIWQAQFSYRPASVVALLAPGADNALPGDLPEPK